MLVIQETNPGDEDGSDPFSTVTGCAHRVREPSYQELIHLVVEGVTVWRACHLSWTLKNV